MLLGSHYNIANPSNNVKSRIRFIHVYYIYNNIKLEIFFRSVRNL